jgi:hypothetical protein
MSGEVRTARVDVFAATKDDLTRFDIIAGPAAIAWPSIDGTEWASGLDRLVGAISGDDPFSFGDHELVFPNHAAGDWDGPWLVRVPEDIVDALATLDRAAIMSYADRVALGEERTSRVIALCELCQRARHERCDLYQWSTD